MKVFGVFEDGIEMLHTLSRQEANFRNQSGNRTSSKRATTKTNKDDLITRHIVCSNETVSLKPI